MGIHTFLHASIMAETVPITYHAISPPRPTPPAPATDSDDGEPTEGRPADRRTAKRLGARIQPLGSNAWQLTTDAWEARSTRG